MGVSGGDCDSFEYEGVTYTESGTYIIGEYQSVYGCDSIWSLNVTITHTPQPEDIEGPSEVDVRLSPISTYSLTPNEGASYMWTIEPAEAGTFDISNSYTANITWSENYKGEATVFAYEDNVCGDALNQKVVTVRNTTDVNEYSIEARIFPNPANDIVTIEAENMRQITVFNTFGQALYNMETENDMVKVNMAPFGTGTYLIRIHTDSGIVIKRISIIK